MGNTFYFEWEIKLMELLQNHIGAVGKSLVSFFTIFGEEMFFVAVLMFLYWCFDKKFGKYVGITILSSIVLNTLIKNIFVRRRPYFDSTKIRCLKPVHPGANLYSVEAQGFSFPSGHSMGSAATYGSVAYYTKKSVLIAAAVVLIFGVGMTRVCLGVHYPTDVLVGWACGTMLVFLISYLERKIPNEKLLYALIALCGCPGLFYCKSNDYFTGYGLMLGAFLGFLFEEKYVNFEMTKSWLNCLLRMIGGLAVFGVLSTLLKLPFSKELLQSVTLTGHMIRLIRYLILSFVLVGVYPMIFKKIKIK